MSVVELPGEEPTGQVAYPFILVEGEEKAGKTSAALMLSRSPNIGHTFVVELGESRADEYKRLGKYRIIRHDGTYNGVLSALETATKAPRVEGKPNLIIFDTASALWEMEKARVDRRARNSKNGQRILAKDPDAEVPTPFNLWSDAKVRWKRVVNLLRSWDGIAVVIARGKESIKLENGKPVEGQSDWKVDAEKDLIYDVDAWVRMTRPHTATLMAAGTWNVEVPKEGLPLPDQQPLHALVYDILGGATAEPEFAPTTVVNPVIGRPVPEARNALVEAFSRSCDHETALREAQTVWRSVKLGLLKETDEVTDEQWSQVMKLTADRIVELTGDQAGGWGEQVSEQVSEQGAEHPLNRDEQVSEQVSEQVREQGGEQARHMSAQTDQKPPLRVVHAKQQIDHRSRLKDELRKRKLVGPDRWKLVKEVTGKQVTSLDDLSNDQCQMVCDTLESLYEGAS